MILFSSVAVSERVDEAFSEDLTNSILEIFMGCNCHCWGQFLMPLSDKKPQSKAEVQAEDEDEVSVPVSRHKMMRSASLCPSRRRG